MSAAADGVDRKAMEMMVFGSELLFSSLDLVCQGASKMGDSTVGGSSSFIPHVDHLLINISLCGSLSLGDVLEEGKTIQILGVCGLC